MWKGGKPAVDLHCTFHFMICAQNRLKSAPVHGRRPRRSQAPIYMARPSSAKGPSSERLVSLLPEKLGSDKNYAKNPMQG